MIKKSPLLRGFPISVVCNLVCSNCDSKESNIGSELCSFNPNNVAPEFPLYVNEGLLVITNPDNPFENKLLEALSKDFLVWLVECNNQISMLLVLLSF